MSDVEPLNHDCACCQSKTCDTPEEATIALLVAVLLHRWKTGEDFDTWIDSLCFYHRRQVDSYVAECISDDQ